MDLPVLDHTKRKHTSPTGLTPQQRRSKIPLPVRRSASQTTPRCDNVMASPIPTNLSPQQPEMRKMLPSSNLSAARSTYPYPASRQCKWLIEEEKALVFFILLSSLGNTWPTYNQYPPKFWDSASAFVHEQAHAPQRTALACWFRVKDVLSKKYESPKDAEIQLNAVAPSRLPNPCEHVHQCSSIEVIDRFETIIRAFQALSMPDQLELLTVLFQQHALDNHSVHVSEDFLGLVLKAMANLKSKAKSNVLYDLARSLGTFRPDSTESLLPVSRMPFGLLQYMVSFFAASSGDKVQCSKDYSDWLVSMHSLFGTKFSKMFRGPMWSMESTTQGKRYFSSMLDPIMARVNVPAPSDRTLRRCIVKSGFSNSFDIQMATLDKASAVHPDARWWVKADGCDLTSGLEESVRLEWHGDADYGTSSVKELYSVYRSRLNSIDNLVSDIPLVEPERRLSVIESLKEEYDILREDINFIVEALRKASDCYSSSVNSGSDKKLLQMAWNVDDLNRLSGSGRSLRTEVITLKEVLEDASSDILTLNVAKKLCNLKYQLSDFVKGLYRHKRTAATHIMVVMISNESRIRKPYALPVQCFSYVGITVQQMRCILDGVITAMKARNMSVNGFVSNGEFNSMRVKGYTRPLSVLQIKADAKKIFAKMALSTMMCMLSLKETSPGNFVPVKPNPAVSMKVLREIQAWKDAGVTDEDWIQRLRIRTVPFGYVPHPWSDEREEDTADMLRAILAQMEYQYQVHMWDCKGVPFSRHMYVPEIHPITGKEFHEREDMAHVLKRIAQCTRRGGPTKLRMDKFHEAVYNAQTGLTYPALTGQRKQDAELLFSKGVQEFMARKGYKYEEYFVSRIRNWRRACDERGISSRLRSKYNYQMLNMIIEELMPWYKEIYDFSLIEVTRPITVLGFTREIVHALVAGIESMEWKRIEYANLEIPMENPRSGTTDDVECMFSIMRDLVGKHFTLREAQNTWRKCCIEFTKRVDPDLGFYYFSSAHHRFYEGDHPHFDEQPLRRRKQKRVRRRELPSHLMYGRATLPQPGARSTRMTFHNLPLPMPPPLESSQSHVFEHSYACN